MKYTMMNPETIMTIVVSIIIFAVGVYATFVTIGSFNGQTLSTLPKSNGIGVLGGTGNTVGLANNVTNPRFVQCPGINVNLLNSTTGFSMRNYGQTGAVGGYTVGWSTQSTFNGTIMANSTVRVNGGTCKAHNTTFEITYNFLNPAYVAGYYGMKNTTGVGSNVFNVIGIVLIIGAIMMIVGIIYGYVKPGGGKY